MSDSVVNRRALLRAALAAPLMRGVAAASSRRIELLYRSPDGHPNALEATPEGLWVGEQTTDAACLLDWKTGKLLRRVETESSNTSGMAFGGGFLWMAANGPAVGRAPRPHDAKSGEIVKVDPATGKTAARLPVPGGGGVHGLLWWKDSLWVTTLKRRSLTRIDPAGKVLHEIPVALDRAHGLGWDGSALWCMFSNDRVIHRLDPEDGRILEVVRLAPEDPDPHGMEWFRGSLYYCDAGIAPGGGSNGSKFAGYICRIENR
jgi:streptogramin lyase